VLPLDRDALVGERRAGRGHFSGDRGGLEALHDQPHGKRELSSGHRDNREGGEPGQGGVLPEQHCDDGGDEQGAPMSPSTGMMRGTSRDRYSREPSSSALMAGMRVCPSRTSGCKPRRATRRWCRRSVGEQASRA
jgi:hypothetical protein